MSSNDLTIIYATAHKVPEGFRRNIFDKLMENSGDYDIYKVECSPEEASITNYYRQLIETAKKVTTPYLAFAEDDTLYPDEHFNQRPSDLKTFAYNMTRWNLYTWSKPPFFSLRQRKILATLIAPREEFIRVMEQRLLDPDESKMVEPGRRKGELTEDFNTYNPVIVFTHPEARGYLGGNKRANKIRATAIPFWGSAQDIADLYKENV